MKVIKICIITVAIIVVIALVDPISKLFGEILRAFFNQLELITSDYKYTIQALSSFGIVGIFWTWYRHRKNEQERLMRGLMSISVIDVYPDATATVKNTVTVDGSALRVKIYKPKDFEQWERNEEYYKYVANNKEQYDENKKSLIEAGFIEWEKEPTLDILLSIGDVAQFHLKNINKLAEDLQESDPNKSGGFLHFAPIKLRISTEGINRKEIIKYMLFQFANEDLRSNSDDFFRDRLHPYGKWVLIYSRILKT